MGWIFLIIWLVCGVLYNLFDMAGKDLPEGSKEKKTNTIIKYTPVVIIGLSIVCLICYLIGWIWYYFCGGFLIFEDQPFLDKVFCGFLSVVMLILVFGGIAVLMGWDPDKK